MTLVWKRRTGAPMQTEVGTIDIVNTFSAARSIHGWIEGADGLRFLFQQFLHPLGRKLKDLKLDQNLRLMPFQAHVLTSHGPLVPVLNDDAKGSFGGDIRLQVISTTICALAHECRALTSVRLFIEYLLPYLFEGDELLRNVLQGQLIENSTLEKIINEGTTRGLNTLFNETAAKLDLPSANSGWGPVKLNKSDLDYKISGPVCMIGGLLKWISLDNSHEYRTRSSAVARIAAYLKEKGYNISNIITWTDIGTLPNTIGTKVVVLVLGGASETDPLMNETYAIDTPLVLHY